MPSANGYKLVFGPFEVTAAWAAPFFVLDATPCTLAAEEDREPERPRLYHAESLADARRRAAFGGVILNADFTRYVPSDR